MSSLPVVLRSVEPRVVAKHRTRALPVVRNDSDVSRGRRFLLGGVTPETRPPTASADGDGREDSTMAKTMSMMKMAVAALALVLACAGISVPAFAATLDNGTYSVSVSMTGGSGKATIESPAKLKVDNGKAILTVVWSSSSYDMMEVNGVQYKPTTVKPASTFEIPVLAFDAAFPVKGETTAMGKPHVIDYEITVDSASAQKQAPEVPVIPIVIGVAVVAVVVVVGVLTTKRKKA